MDSKIHVKANIPFKKHGTSSYLINTGVSTKEISELFPVLATPDLEN